MRILERASLRLRARQAVTPDMCTYCIKQIGVLYYLELFPMAARPSSSRGCWSQRRHDKSEVWITDEVRYSSVLVLKPGGGGVAV